jgi:DeoR/GlpR family transcriptional regulator of sugar metabolism
MNKNDSYLKAERHHQIQTIINERSRATVQELSILFGVSEATIRRDLEELSNLGLILRTHGGAVRAITAPKEPPMMQRMGENPEEKACIGKAAVALIGDGDTIFLGSGTTVLEVARNLPAGINLTVITNSLPVVNEIATRPGIELIVIGGMLRQSELSMVGHVAEQAVREFRADRVFMGMYAVDVSCGFTNDYPPEISTDRAILSIAPQVIILVDHSKFGRVSSMLLAPLTAAQIIITDQNTPSTTLDELQALGIQAIRATG